MADFAGMLSRLVARRGLDARALAQAVGVPDTELTTVFGGAQPSAALLRLLAPVFGLHASDLFLVAGVRVPDDLAPAISSPGGVDSLVWDLIYLPQVGQRVHELLRTMVGQVGTQPAGEREYDRWWRPGFGAVLMRLFGNRNMSVSGAVKVLYMLTGFGPWAASTLNKVGFGRKEVCGHLVAASAVVLGIPAGDLAALADVQLPEQAERAHPAASAARELIWEARDLPGPQMEQLQEQAHLIRHEYDDVTPPSLLCHCSLFRGSKMETPPTIP